MKSYDAYHVRNVSLLGHGGAGKTTLAEAMLFESGEIPRRGTIEDRSTSSDFHEIEHERQSSVFGSVLFAEWRDYKINIIDTPGYADYIGEVLGALRVSDTALLVLHAQHGVEVGSELIWNATKTFGTPVICVVNKVDLEQSNFWRTVDQAKERFGRQVTVVQYPLVEGSSFSTIIDIVSMCAYVFPAGGGKPAKDAIPESENERVAKLRSELIEIIAENDETLMEHYLSTGALDEAELRSGLTASLIHRDLVPVMCSSAKRNMGAGRLMSFIDLFIPAPVEMPPVATVSGQTVAADPQGTTCMFVFKATSEPNTGDMSFFRVYSGTIHHGMDLVNEQTGVTERIGTLYVVNGKTRHEVPSLAAGDIGAVVKLKNTHVNNTLHEKGANLVLPPIVFPHPRVRVAVSMPTRGDEDKLGIALHHLHEEDPTLIVEHSSELQQVLLHAQGAQHVAAAKHRLRSRFQIDVEFSPARIPYRETIRKRVDGQYRHKKQTGGSGQFAEVQLRIEPLLPGEPQPQDVPIRSVELVELPWGGHLEFANCIVGGAIDQRFLPAILKGVMERMHHGPITGSRVRDVRVLVIDGKMHPVDSSEAAFKAAARIAFRDAFMTADPQLLEPVHTVRVRIPEELVGDVMSDLPVRRAEITGIEQDGHYHIVECHMPLAELDSYASTLSSISGGRGAFDAEFFAYQPVPQSLVAGLRASYIDQNHED